MSGRLVESSDALRMVFSWNRPAAFFRVIKLMHQFAARNSGREHPEGQERLLRPVLRLMRCPGGNMDEVERPEPVDPALDVARSLAFEDREGLAEAVFVKRQ